MARLTKKKMSIKIATVLLNADKTLDESNWKVQDLMKRTFPELEDSYKLACKIEPKSCPCKNDQGCFLPK